MWHCQGNTLCNLPKILTYFKKSALFLCRPLNGKENKNQLCVLCVCGENNLISKLPCLD